jgi:hypothetical protein
MENESKRMTFPERRVAECLKKLNIEWIYEQPVFVWNDDDRPRVWSPDFYFAQFGIYLEVYGSNDFGYNYRKRFFTKNSYCVIFLYCFKGMEKWEYHLRKRLKHFHLEREKAMEKLV